MAKRSRNTDDDFEDDDEENDDEETDEELSEGGKKLIRKLRGEIKQAKRENKTLREEADTFKQEREDRIFESEDLKEFSERKRKIVMREIEESDSEVSLDNVREIAAELGYVEIDESVTNNESDAETRIDNATNGAKRGKGASKITAKDFGAWEPEKRRRFMTNHKEEFEALKRGESVQVPTFQ